MTSNSSRVLVEYVTYIAKRAAVGFFNATIVRKIVTFSKPTFLPLLESLYPKLPHTLRRSPRHHHLRNSLTRNSTEHNPHTPMTNCKRNILPVGSGSQNRMLIRSFRPQSSPYWFNRATVKGRSEPNN